MSLPDSLISWVAVRAMPEFLSNLRAACLKLRGRVGSVLPTPDLLQQRALTSQFSILSCTEEEEVDLSRKAEYETDWIDQLLKDEIAELEPDPAEPVVVVESKNTDSEREPESTESRQGGAAASYRDRAYAPLSPSLHNLSSNIVHFKTEDKISPISEDFVAIKEVHQNLFQQKTLEEYFASKKSPNKTIEMKGESSPAAPTPISSLVDSCARRTLILNDEETCEDIQDMSAHYLENEFILLSEEESAISEEFELLDQQLRAVRVECEEWKRLLQRWCETVSRKNLVFHRRLELELVEQAAGLEGVAAQLREEVRGCAGDADRETELLAMLVSNVNMRDRLERCREQQELDRVQATQEDGQLQIPSKTNCSLS